jgi:hypothetical protein
MVGVCSTRKARRYSVGGVFRVFSAQSDTREMIPRAMIPVAEFDEDAGVWNGASMDVLITIGIFVVGLILAIMWAFLPWWLLRRMDALEREAKAANAQMEQLVQHVAALNTNLVAYGQSMERRLDAVAGGQQKTPGQRGSGVRYEILE